MFRQYNNNPNGYKIGDCVIRAIATAEDRSWSDIYIDLCLQGYLMSDLPSSNAVWNAYLNNKGYIREFIHNDCSECYTIQDFIAEHPVGIYIIGTGTHATVIIDGILYDTWDCGGEQPIYFYHKEGQK